MNDHNRENKKPIRPYKILKLINKILTILIHFSTALLIMFSYQYQSLSKSTFVCILGILVCLLIILDLILYVGCNFKARKLRIVNLIFAVIMLVMTTYGAITMYQVTSSVNKIIENSGVEQYEDISVVFVSYENKYEKLSEINGKKVGTLYETNVGTSSLGKEKLETEKVICDYVDCSSINDLFYSLVDGSIDVAIMPGSYRQVFENNSDYDYSAYLEKLHDFYSFSEKVLVDENESANKDLTLEPFNVLLIGFAQNNAESSYGLADAIIVATVNPGTMTVSLTSIARDSYVPISCYGGTKDKINAARGTSRACLMETVSDLLDMNIDFYVEANFEGVVDIVDALGGIMIDSPVEFVGQNSSYTRGEMTVLVTAGPHYAMGEEVLAFARERHAMPNGDFDRQVHQKEVIEEIVKRTLELRDINKVLKILEACGDNISTNVSIEQITSIFNYILNAPNYMEVDQFNLIDMQSLRITGYSSWHYNEQLELPVWIYKLYNGSIEETVNRISDTLGNYKEINQTNKFYFFTYYPYQRDALYSSSFDEEEVHETLPLYCPYLTTMTYAEADAWAQKNGLNLSVNFVTSGYDESMAGMVVDQSTNYGKKLNAGDTVGITVFGIDESKCVPNFVGKSYLEAVEWAKEHNYTITLEEVTDGVEGKGGTVISQTPTANSLIEKYNTLVLKYYALATLDASKLVGKTKDEVTTWAKTYMYYPDTITYKNLITDDSTKVGKVASATFSGGTSAKSTDKTLVVTIYVKAQNYTINFAVDPTGSGTVSVNGTVTTSGSYSNASKITLTANQQTGYVFSGWYIGSDALSSNNPLEYLPEKDVTITAKFRALSKYNVSVSSSDTTMGSVTASETGELYEGTIINISATANAGYRFVQWSDGDANASRSITVTGALGLTAEFEARTSATITVSSTEGGVATPASSNVYVGDSITLSASPIGGYNFVGWYNGENLLSVDANYSFTVSESLSLTAKFELAPTE